MSRLVFAAARGARIEKKFQGVWCLEIWIDTSKAPLFEFRIHPDDEHLAYGPISTALRAGADQYSSKQPRGLDRMLALQFVEFHRRGCGKLGQHCDPELHRSLFLLILSEVLADEGM